MPYLDSYDHSRWELFPPRLKQRHKVWWQWIEFHFLELILVCRCRAVSTERSQFHQRDAQDIRHWKISPNVWCPATWGFREDIRVMRIRTCHLNVRSLRNAQGNVGNLQVPYSNLKSRCTTTEIILQFQYYKASASECSTDLIYISWLRRERVHSSEARRSLLWLWRILAISLWFPWISSSNPYYPQ